MPVLKLYKDKNIDCKIDLVSIEDYLIKMMNAELNAKVENCQIIWITTEIFKCENKIYGELLLRKNENRTNLIKNNFLPILFKKIFLIKLVRFSFFRKSNSP